MSDIKVLPYFASLSPFNGHVKVVLPLLYLLQGLLVGEGGALLPVDPDEDVVQLEADQLGHAAGADLRMRGGGHVLWYYKCGPVAADRVATH